MENYAYQPEVPVPDGTMKVRADGLEIGHRVLSDPAAERQEFLDVVGVEQRGGLVFVTYRFRDDPVEYRAGQFLFIKA